MKKVITLIVVLALIVIAAIAINLYTPKIRSYLPENISSPGKTVSGKVLAKRLKGDSLLLTVNTDEGAMLVTFNKKIDEIDLLVSPGDIIEFSYISYRPFLTDPVISRVRKEEKTAPLIRETPEEHPKVEKPEIESPAIEQPSEMKQDESNTIQEEGNTL